MYNFLESIKNTVASSMCFTNTRLMPDSEFQNSIRRNASSATINSEIDQEIDEPMDEIIERTNNENNNENTIRTDEYSVNIQDNRNLKLFNGKSAIIYIRASTKEQNVESQQYACEQYCKVNKLKIKNIYIEKCSAYKKDSQPKLNVLIKNNKNTNLIVFSVDRFSRNVKKSHSYILDLEFNNIVLISVKENLNLNTAFGKHNFRTLVNAAQYESELISERVKNSIKYRKANKIHIGQTPYGFKKLNKQLIRDSEETAIIRFIITTYKKHMDSNTMSEKLFHLLRNLNRPKKDFVEVSFTDEDKKYEYYQYNKLEKILISASIISDILNDYNIKKRNKLWTVSAVTRISNQYYKNLKQFENLNI